jgi:dimethylargininase
MGLAAITREVSDSINACELSFHVRQPIDSDRAIAQHAAYRDCLARLGLQLISLPAEPALPDAVFVEDTAVVVDETAIICNIGAPSRRPEARSMATALSRYRTLKFIKEPATLDGGDVLQPIGRRIFVGLSRRTNRAGIEQLRGLLQPFDYEVNLVEVKDCLHLRAACSYIGNDTILMNRDWVNTEPFRGLRLIDVAADEPAGANALLIEGVLIMPNSCPKTLAVLKEQGFQIRTVDVSELQKAEAGVTCCSIIFRID